MNGPNSNSNNNNAGGGGSRNVREEQVVYHVDPEHPDFYTARISVATTKASGKVEKTFRQFEASDMERVLDYEDCVDAPSDGAMMVGEDDGNGGYKFPTRHCCLRGNFVFFFSTEDVDDKSGPYATYHAPPLGVIPLDHVDIQFPPGGRRVFREHAHTDARNGYEYVVIHEPPELSDDEGDTGVVTEKKEGEPGAEGQAAAQPEEPSGPTARDPVFLVALSLGERQQWADAISSRSKNGGQATMLRASYSTSRATGGGKGALSGGGVASVRQDASQGDRRKSTKTGDKENGNNLFDGGDNEVTPAVNEFGVTGFSETAWMDNFFKQHHDYDAPDKCDQMEHWQASIKKNLKAAVLEQYEYFVQASGEMTTMGKEVSSLKSLVETQMETIREMKEIDFSGTLHGFTKDEANVVGAEDEKQNGKKNRGKKTGLFGDEESELSSVLDDHSTHLDDRFMRGFGKNGNNLNQSEAQESNADDPAHMIEVPSWMDDVGEEISAFVKESRYTDAIDLWTKAKFEISELFDKVSYLLVWYHVPLYVCVFVSV